MLHKKNSASIDLICFSVAGIMCNPHKYNSAIYQQTQAKVEASHWESRWILSPNSSRGGQDRYLSLEHKAHNFTPCACLHTPVSRSL